jgi:hypothetical protein
MIIGLIGVVAVLSASAATAANTLAVTNAAAIDGAYGLEVSIDGSSSDLAYVEDNSPAGETVYRAQFWLDHNNPTMAIGDAVNIFRGVQDTGDKKNILVKMKKGKDSNIYIYAFCQNNAGGWVLANKGMLFKDKATGVMIEWQAATTAGANDGFLKMYKVTISGGAVLKGQATGINNDTKIVDTARMGLTNAPAAGLAGTLYFDSFESYRTMAP